MSSPVEQIKSRLNIVEVVQSYLRLQKAGINYRAKCPFHSEKTPSFFVSPSRESWHCFGCNKGGDIFSFVMEIEGADFFEALKILASRAGVELKPVDSKYRTERSRLLQLMEDAKNFYESELKKNKKVIDYLKSRGLKGETAKAFGMGFASDGWRNLCDFLKNKNYSDLEMEKSGMIIKNQNSYYDRFRSRIMFPVSNSSGQIVGFSGRIFGEENEATGGKYINTPQTILYDKSRILYAFDKAKIDIKKKDICILVEGQMDVIMSHQAGFTNTVAVSGTALTREHLEIIKRLTDNILVAFDKDEAGIGATGRGIDLALAQGFEVRALSVPSGKDPADSIKENPEEWGRAVSCAKNVIEFYLDSLKDRKEIRKTILPRIAVIPSDMEKAHWVAETARRLKISEQSVWEELKKTKTESLKEDKERLPEEEKNRPRINFIKDRLFGFILWQQKTDNQELKAVIKEFLEKSGLNLDDSEIKEKADRIVFEAELFFGGIDSLKKEFEKLILEFEKETLKSELLKITNRIRELEISGGDEELGKQLKRFNELSKKIKI